MKGHTLIQKDFLHPPIKMYLPLNMFYKECRGWGQGIEITQPDQAGIGLHNSDFKLIKGYLKFCLLSIEMETFILDSLVNFHTRSYLTYSPPLIPCVYWKCKSLLLFNFRCED